MFFGFQIMFGAGFDSSAGPPHLLRSCLSVQWRENWQKFQGNEVWCRPFPVGILTTSTYAFRPPPVAKVGLGRFS